MGECKMIRSNYIVRLCVAAMLTAIGIVIPMFMPLKFVLEPASFTLASHVATFIAMLISPGVTLVVCFGTAAGFLLGGFPLVIVLRAATHVVFAMCGTFYLKSHPQILSQPVGLRIFSLLIGIIHGACEVVAVSVFYFGGSMGEAYYQAGFLQSVLLLVGVGTAIHSMVDFEIALLLRRALIKEKTIGALFIKSPPDRSRFPVAG
jgi:niacin transporter